MKLLDHNEKKNMVPYGDCICLIKKNNNCTTMHRGFLKIWTPAFPSGLHSCTGSSPVLKLLTLILLHTVSFCKKLLQVRYNLIISWLGCCSASAYFSHRWLKFGLNTSEPAIIGVIDGPAITPWVYKTQFINQLSQMENNQVNSDCAQSDAVTFQQWHCILNTIDGIADYSTHAVKRDGGDWLIFSLKVTHGAHFFPVTKKSARFPHQHIQCW